MAKKEKKPKPEPPSGAPPSPPDPAPANDNEPAVEQRQEIDTSGNRYDGAEAWKEPSQKADSRDKLPAGDHLPGAGPADYAQLARDCHKAGTLGHGATRDRELLVQAAVALAELGGFDL